MSADILRRAAALMRERATNARAGVWTALPSVLEPDTTLVLAEWEHDRRRVATTSGSLPQGNAANAEHIASWHPAVALRAADALEQSAKVLIEAHGTPLAMAMTALTEPLVDLARAYLGES